MNDLTSRGIQKVCRERPGTFKRFLAGSFVAAALLSSPMLEQTALAQQPEVQAQSQRRDVRYDVTGSSQVSLASGSDQIQAYIVMTDASVPTLSFEGPAVVNARFYPTIRPADVANGPIPMSVRYSVDNGAPTEASFTTGSSAVTHPTLTQNGLAIGTPKDLQITVTGEGRHTVAVGFPNGFIVISSVTAPQEAPAPQVPVPVPRTPEQVRTPGQDTQPQQPSARQLGSIRSRISLDYESIWHNGFGNAGTSGSIHTLDLLYRHPFGEHVALIVGPRLSLFDSSISPSGASTRSMMGDASVMAGIGLYFGDLTL